MLYTTGMALGRAHTSARLNSLDFVAHRKAGSASGPEPKSNRLVRVTYLNHPPSKITCPRHFEISCYTSFLALSLTGEESLKKF